MRTWVTMTMFMMLMSTNVAWADDVPNVLSFQSSLYDEGGNPIQDGANDIHFRIIDDAGSLLYEEYQNIDVIRGAVSVLIGNGLTVDGAPTGGIPEGIFDSGGPKYLDLNVGDGPPMGPMEIASVPYAIISSLSNGVSEGAVDSKAIADGGIQYEDLSDDLIDKLSNEMTGGREIVFKDELESMYRGPGSAAKIGVHQGLNYSGANDLQGVIVDMDQAIRHREERIAAEAEARANDVANLQSGIAAEAVSRQQADAGETSARQTADANESSARQQADANESSARQSADSNLQSGIDNEISNRQGADNGLQAAIDSKVSKGGDVIEGNLNISGTVDGVDVSNHDHSGEGQGGFLFPGAIWFDAGYRWDGEAVGVPDGYGSGNCAATAAFGRTGDGAAFEQLDNLCVRADWDGSSIVIRCRMFSGGEAHSCDELWGSDKSAQCIASYVVICAKK